MKTRIVCILIFICLSSFCLLSQDTWLENIYVPDIFSQASPHSIVYNENNQKYYVYTGQRILIADKQSGILENPIYVGLTGYYDTYYSSIERNHKLAIDLSRNYIYCANEDDALKIYDCDDNSLIHQFNSWEPLISSFIYYNTELDRIYWIQNSVQLNGRNRLTVINPDDWSNIYVETSNERQIFDIEFCLTNSFLNKDYLVLSTTSTASPSGYIRLINPINLSTYDSFVLPVQNANKLLYVDEFNRLYCLTSNSTTSILQAFSINSAANQFDYLENYSISNFPVYISESACFVEDIFNYAYITGGDHTGLRKLVIFDYTRQNNNEPIIAEYQFPNVDQVIVGLNEKVFSSGNNLNRLFGSTIEGTVSINGTANHLVKAGDGLVLSNLEGNSIDSYDFSLNLTQRVHLGNAILRGVINTQNQKIYWIPNQTLYAAAFLSIQDLSDNSFNSIEIGTYISDLAYHAYSNKTVVSNFHYSGSKLTIVDGYSDNVEIIASDFVNILKPGLNNKTYLGGVDLLKYIEMDNNSIEEVQNNNLNEHYEIIDFEILNNGDCMALATENGIYGCKLLKIDKNTNEIVATLPLSRTPVGHRDGLFYNSSKNQLYLLSEYYLTVIDPLTLQQISEITQPEDDLFLKCHYSPRSEKVLVICKNNRKVLSYNANNFSLNNQFELPVNAIIKSSFYNSINDLLYLHHTKYDLNLYKNEIRLLSIRCDDFQVQSDIYLQQNTLKNVSSATLTAQIVWDESTNTIFIPNEGLGNISKVNCSDDQLILQPRTWNWISFPRLEREGNGEVSTVEQLENIAPFPDNITMTRWVPLGQGTIDKVWNGIIWTGNLNTVQSTLGYKLETNNPGVSALPMTGTVLAPETTMPLYADGLAIKTNWTGYYLPVVQSPFDAIGEEFLEDMNMLKGKFWSCFKKDPGHTKTTGSIWGCACQQGRVEIKYGDMIEIYATEDISEFHWQMGWMQPESEPKPPSLTFQYKEKAEYDALFIELDTLNLPEEIGAFAGDSCIGATTVLPSDTMALICAYTEGFEGEEITFELLYPTKTARPRCRDYSVLNTTTGIQEKRRIVAGENQPYFLVSFKSQENIPAKETAFNVIVRPNPAGNEFTVSYFTGQEALVELSLINALGLPVRSWQRGIHGAGSYSMAISTAGLPSGCYYLKVKAGNAVEIQKIMIIH